jgi:hypothetical protein
VCARFRSIGNRATVKCKRTCRNAQPSNPFFESHLTMRGKILGGGWGGGLNSAGGGLEALLLCGVACDTQAHSERSVR